tara:strand:- start:91 stop:477 length:387 start_codon:yes stop_codon:yes gene_type:complete
MKKLIFIILLLASTNAFADYNWKSVAKSSNGNVDYVDLKSIKRLGDKVFYNRLRDYIRPNKWGDLSSIIYIEINCVNFDQRYLKDLYFDQPMGNGKVTTVNNETSEWNKTKKGTVGREAGKFACNYKK